MSNLLLLQCFQKSSATEASESVYMWERVNHKYLKRRNSRKHEQLKLDNNKNHWDHLYILDELNVDGSTKTDFYFDELYLLQNATLELKKEDDVNKTLECNKYYGDGSGRIKLQVVYLV